MPVILNILSIGKSIDEANILGFLEGGVEGKYKVTAFLFGMKKYFIIRNDCIALNVLKAIEMYILKNLFNSFILERERECYGMQVGRGADGKDLKQTPC